MGARLRLALVPADPRQALRQLADERGESLSALSRMIDRSPGYLARFISEGRPAALTHDNHHRLCTYLGAGEFGLGIRDIWVPRT
ncbi:hypothetical protein C8J24_1735 [Sphingomonas aerolata]|uniref:Uncharacterized protein n=1 Tax=Sphingomonas aerolata TaxID=185951 RepID=A0A2T4YPT8_9SPHN|nr:hypothetical protein [Sphingomonas aerolata]PTM45511.1 hypothetical protein C8J24_1735 [Sphingomonas aerolata]